MSETRPIIHVVLLEADQQWVAQGVNIDVAAQGRSMELAKRAFLRMLEAQAQLDEQNGKAPFEGIPEAPEEIWEIFINHSEFLGKTKVTLPHQVPGYVFEMLAQRDGAELQ